MKPQEELRIEYVDARQEIGDNNPNQYQDSFFELLYGVLDARYNRKDGLIERQRIADFFKNHDWRCGHDFSSLLYVIRWIHYDVAISTADKTFYVNFMRSHISSDEMRLTFYYLISRKEPELSQMIKIVDHYKFFDDVLPELIFQGAQDGDTTYYEELGKK